MVAKNELLSVAKRIVKLSVDLRTDDKVCVVTDTNKLSIGWALLEASKSSGSESVMVIMNPTRMHGNEPPKIVAGAMKHATVVFTVVTYAMTHTNAFKESLQAGARAIVMRGVDEEMMVKGAIKANYRQINKRSQALAQLLRSSSKVHVSSTRGTDLTFEILGRPVFALGGIATEPGTFAAMPDGEVALSPSEGTANGRIVFDYSIDGIGKLKKPIEIGVSQGRINNVVGGPEAKRFRKLVKDAGECGHTVAEFALGTNPFARLIGNLAEDKKKEGTVHVAIGDNHVLGGSVDCSIHLDGLMTTPTVLIDDKIEIVQKGKMNWRKITS